MSTRSMIELIETYDRPGPRYTSYPTANLFDEAVAGEVLRDDLRARPEPTEPLSLYVHVPFCKSLCWYCGCNMKVSRNRRLMDAHVALIIDEIEATARAVHPDRPVRQIHFGGGTPNYLEPDRLIALVEAMRARFSVAEDAEISIEIDPRVQDMRRLDAVVAAGFNRVSIGIQDFDPAVQRAIHRENSHDMVCRVFRDLREAGIGTINVDLIYGLPLQTPASFAASLERVIALDPSRIALFNFAYLPILKPHMKLIRAKDLPTPREKLAILEASVDRLEEVGYLFIGIDHFARPDDSLARAFCEGTMHRNFQGYTTHAGLEMLGFGMSAISQRDSLYVQNHARITDWEAAVRAGMSPVARGYRLTEDDRIRRDIINHLMCTYSVDIPLIESRVGDFETTFPGVGEALESMTRDGLLIPEGRRLVATRLGRFLLRNIAMLFDGHLGRAKGARFSRTV